MHKRRIEIDIFLIVFLFFVFAILNSNNAIAISGAVEEFVIVMVEFTLIAKDPVALILNL